MKPTPGRDVAGGGLTLTVTGDAMALVGADTDIADTVELHTMSMEDGVMRMRKVEQLDVSEDAPLVLESGGAHLMLFGVSPDIEIGETVDLVLTLTGSDGSESTLTTEAEIRGSSPRRSFLRPSCLKFILQNHAVRPIGGQA